MTFDEIIEETRRTQDRDIIFEAAESLALLAEHDRPSILARLRRLLGERHLSLRRLAVVTLGILGETEAAELLRPFLEARSGLLKRDALRALTLLRDDAAAADMVRCLGDKKASVRLEAVQALAELRGAEALDGLRARLDSEGDYRVREALVAALPRFADEDRRALVLRVLLGHAILEKDRRLQRRCIDEADALAAELSREDVLLELKKLPEAVRPTLARVLADHIHELGSILKQLLTELRARSPDRSVLSGYGSDLVERARLGGTGAIYERDELIERMIERLSRRGPRSILLVGPSGVGKSALVHELARRLADAPVMVAPVLMEVTTGDILSGTRYLGEWQTRLSDFMKQLRAPRRALWYVPDVNRLLDAGMTNKSNENFASMLAPDLERGDITIVGESTVAEFRRGIDRRPSFRKHFLVIRVEEPSPTAMDRILVALARDYAAEFTRETGRELIVPSEVVARAAALGETYFPTLARPGNGITLLQESFDALTTRYQRIREDDDAAPGPFGLPRPRRKPATRRLDDEAGPVTLRDAHVIQTLSERSGVPEFMLNDEIPLDLSKVQRAFSERVLGQEQAVAVIADLIAMIKSDLTDPQKPLGILFFVGPTGVGKTEMAKALASFLFSSEERLVRLDMADYQNFESYRRLIGSDRGDGGSSQGDLTAPVRERPFSVVLLDEIEKAHHNVFDLLLPVLDDGRLSDERGQVTDFRRAIIVMTSNVASDLSEGLKPGFGDGKAPAEDEEDRRAFEEKVLKAMHDFFRPEFVNRIDKTVVFKPLSLETRREIIRREVKRMLTRPGVLRRRAVVDLDDSVIGLLMREGFSARFGARPLKRRVENLVLRPLAHAFLRLPGEAGSDPAVVRLTAAGGRIVAQIARPDDEGEAAAEPSGSKALDRLAVLDPMRHGRRIGVEDLRERAIAYRERLEDLEELNREAGLVERKAALMRRSHRADFWSDAEAAGEVMSEIAAIEKQTQLPGALRERLDAMEVLLQRATHEGGQQQLLFRAASASLEIHRSLEFAEFAARCPEPRDRGDAYLVLRRIGERAHDSDLAARLARAYLSWAKRKGFQARAILETLDEQDHVQEATLLIAGPCAYGLLKGEAGLHQFASRYEGNRRDIDYLRVDVIPDLREGPRVKNSEVWEERRSFKRGQAVLLPEKPRSYVVMSHRKTSVTVEGACTGKRKEAFEQARPILEARVRAALEDQKNSAAVESVEEARSRFDMVRKYQLTPQRWVRDLASGIKSFDLDRVLGGEIDDFIVARLDIAPREERRDPAET